MHKMKFGQTYCKYLLTRISRECISYFLSFILFSMNFGTLNEFQEIQNGKRIWKKRNSGRYSAHDFAPLAQPRGENGRSAHVHFVAGTPPWHGHHAWGRRGGAATDSATPA
jgi:hypothetical protein